MKTPLHKRYKHGLVPPLELFVRRTSMGYYVESGLKDFPTIVAGPFTREGARTWLSTMGLTAKLRRGGARFL